MSLELKHLRVLRATREHGTISGAARELGYSQPAVSLQITQLEQSLGAPVLVRTRSGVALTEVGEILLEIADPILDRVAQAMVEIEAIAGLRAGRVRVACFPSAAAVVLPDALATMRQAHPGLSFTLVEREPPQALALLRSGECDLAVVFGYVAEGTMSSGIELLPNERAATMAQETVFVALPRSHPLTARDVVTLADLADDDWIAGCPECRTNLVDLCESAGFTPKIAFETDDHVAMQGLVGAELGVALLPELMVAAGNRTPTIELRPCVPRSKRVVSVVTTTALLRVPGVVQTIEALVAAGRRQLV